MQLEEKWIKVCQSIPEKGMGWQSVNITLTDGTILTDVMVFNCEDVLTKLFISNDEIVSITQGV